MGLPEGVELSQALAVLLPIGLVTVALRGIPFLVRRRLGQSDFVAFLGGMMPVGVMTVLVVYSLVSGGSGAVWPGLIGVAVTGALQWWTGRAALAIIGGTGVYMVLVNGSVG
ncbi:branched-chain amino acid transporter permease [Corynebacterium tapiri]|uniref:Branched-chain amino acid ABC transporter permease n=1 Tax=Corynebacterium tapiri TaxID=1448266 RepID=A0A5C4U3V0_9CORY|nr:AzlD domain-containing protein [Corynebacterium tapiri]TNL96872.1 branched-chain amino acid ABC transporter permease [Corynebacterium tapiri]